MDIGAWLEKLETLHITIDYTADLELANTPVHGQRRRVCAISECNCRAIHAARGRMQRAGLWSPGEWGGVR